MMEAKLTLLRNLQSRLESVAKRHVSTYVQMNMARQLSADPGEVTAAEAAFLEATLEIQELRYLILLVEKDIKNGG